MFDLNLLSRQMEDHLRFCNDIPNEDLKNFFKALQEVPTDKYIEYPDLLMLLSYIDSMKSKAEDMYVNNTLNAAFINSSIWCYIDNGDFIKGEIGDKMVDFVYHCFLNVLLKNAKKEDAGCTIEELEKLSYVVSFKLVGESLVDGFFEFH